MSLKSISIQTVECDCCGKTQGTAYDTTTWYNIHGDDLCHVCFVTIVNDMVKAGVIPKDKYEEIKELAIPESKFRIPNISLY